ncbi:MAG: hypothetical protein J0L58_19955 [Burkholderiales bacterium]|nr:hypothetical protein [Burkholderiales bacterium]
MPRVATPRVQNRLKPRRPPPAPLPALKAHGRSLSDFLPLVSKAEERLLAACREGERARLGATVPTAPTDDTRVRAGFLRFLLLGGDERAPVHEHGVRLYGAWVSGTLDLGGCFVPSSVALVQSHFEGLLVVRDARVTGLLALEGSWLSQGLMADGLQVSSDLVLRNGVKAKGEVRLLGAQIGGDLECSGGQFDVKEGDALSADRAVVKGSVFLDDGFLATGKVRLLGVQIGGNLACRGGQFEAKEGDALSADGAVVKGSVFLYFGFRATGQVRLLGAQIGSNLECRGGQFEGKGGDALVADGAVVKGDVFLREGFKATGRVRLLGAQIGGNLECRGGQFEGTEGDALSAERVVVKGALFLQGVKPAACFNFSHAEVGVLVDDVAAWAPGSVLDGLRYGAIGGEAPTNGAERLEWLSRQKAAHMGEEDFRPQPWRQLQKVLREMGHTEDAKQVGMAFEDKRREIGRVGQSPPSTWWPVAAFKRGVARAVHYGFGKLAGYGFRPMRLMGWMAAVWFLWGASYWFLALPPRNALAPSNPLVFQHPAYAECLPDGEPTPGNWFLCAPLRGEYATLSPFVYSLDILLPLVDLGQEKHWGAYVVTPKAGAGEELLIHWTWGHIARQLIWFETLFGWVCSLLLVAIVSGFARRSDEG